MKVRGKRTFSSTAGLGLAAVALAAFAAACGGGGTSASSSPSASAAAGAAPATGTPHPAGAASVEVTTTNRSPGPFLTSGSGRTLYLFTADSSGKSACYGACATTWPPLTSTDMPKAGSGVAAGKLATITRDDGTKQVTYNGHPLYYYSGDTSTGDVNGQGFGGKWYVLSPTGAGITKAAAAPSSSSGTGTASGSDAGGGW
ncbi:COG4315 family predicted lipoprotein [Actinacidiphila guanduensis]|uniref:Predicted lipoprotein with conserved Yx(FWY)xxD motif n=1 Tax=Actinacidiphila guanduensis TaxID=310781 RepID=A0A1G9WD71_9ACTN|nr:hypothetical protein [Actinacidiphila guanduensis]SDM82126.1 Predicted lipoprotein with conserved Yx(FWY)xxD motif [Actinacidiphila guanduensis]